MKDKNKQLSGDALYRFNQKKNILFWVQAIITIVAIFLAVGALFYKELLLYMEFSVAFLMFIMAINNQIIFKREKFTLFYALTGLFVLGVALYSIWF